MNKMLKYVLLISIALVITVGCGSTAPEPAAAPEGEMESMEGSSDMEGMDHDEEGMMMTLGTVETDDLNVELRGVSPIPAGHETTLEFYLTDADGNPVTGAEIALDLNMTTMEMPANKPGVTEMGEGVYHAPATLGMAGDSWLFTLVINHDGQESTVAFPNVEVGGEGEHSMEDMENMEEMEDMEEGSGNE